MANKHLRLISDQQGRVVWAAIGICPLAANRRLLLMAISSRSVLAPEGHDSLAKCCPRPAP